MSQDLFQNKRPQGDKKCTECGGKGHTKDRCWTIKGYPHWHPKSKIFPQKQRGKEDPKGQKQGRNKEFRLQRSAANVSIDHNQHEQAGNIVFTPQQFEQLLRCFPGPSRSASSETDEELEANFAGLSNQGC